MSHRIIFVTLLALLSGCVQSLRPYYTDDQLTFDAKLVGTWTDAEKRNTLDVSPSAESKSYAVVFTDEQNKKGRFDVHLAKVGNVLLADVLPANPKLDENDTYKAHLMPVHSFVIIEVVSADALRVRTMDYDWARKYLDAHPDEIKFEKLDGDRYLLTGPTAQVQALAVKNLSTKGAYSEATEFHRVSSPSTAPTRPSVP